MLKQIFFAILVKPFMFIIAGLSIRNIHNLPKDEPYIIIANHNSHLDILAIMTMYSNQDISKVSPVAASDYFFKNKYIKWISTQLIGILPIDRKVNRKEGKHPLDGVFKAIEEEKVLIIFPEGSRGEASVMQKFKNGIGHIAKKYPDLKIVPMVLENTGKALPKNEALFIPLIIKLEIKEAICFNQTDLNVNDFVSLLEENFKN
jgi:1-acyl-sn-glycerol-3-phosphate acyltransferase